MAWLKNTNGMVARSRGEGHLPINSIFEEKDLEVIEALTRKGGSCIVISESEAKKALAEAAEAKEKAVKAQKKANYDAKKKALEDAKAKLEQAQLDYEEAQKLVGPAPAPEKDKK